MTTNNKRKEVNKAAAKIARDQRKNESKVRKDRAHRRQKEEQLRGTLMMIRMFLSKLGVIRFPESIAFNLGLFIKHEREPKWRQP